MANSEIKIFYSWQSDLPAYETRNLIQDSIKDTTGVSVVRCIKKIMQSIKKA